MTLAIWNGEDFIPNVVIATLGQVFQIYVENIALRII